MEPIANSRSYSAFNVAGFLQQSVSAASVVTATAAIEDALKGCSYWQQGAFIITAATIAKRSIVDRQHRAAAASFRICLRLS